MLVGMCTLCDCTFEEKIWFCGMSFVNDYSLSGCLCCGVDENIFEKIFIVNSENFQLLIHESE